VSQPQPAGTHQPALGRRLKALRVNRGLSLKEVGAETGVSSSFLSMIETGRNDLSVGRLMVLADFYGVGLDDILRDRPGQPFALRPADGTVPDVAALVFVRRGELMIDFAEESSVVLGEGDSFWFERGNGSRLNV
jgi:transcriptional regulator with XRE-family HTH domain